MKKLNHIFVLATIISIIVVSCKKNDNDIANHPMNDNTDKINMINNYTPNPNDLGNVYYSFMSQYVDKFKQSLPDVSIDSSFWYVETHLNSKFGFDVDSSSYKNDEYYDTVEFSVNGYNNNIPLIDGDELNTFLTNKEIEFIEENTDGDNIFFWCNRFELLEIRTTKVIAAMKVVTAKTFIGVLPPGWNPDEFSHPTCMKAIKPGVCGGTHWLGADEEYERRYKLYPGIRDASQDVILVFHSITIPEALATPELWQIPYISQDISLNTNGTDELNSYLLSTKSLIDSYNPNGSNNIYIGDIDVAGNIIDAGPGYQYTYHGIKIEYFEKIIVNPPTE